MRSSSRAGTTPITVDSDSESTEPSIGRAIAAEDVSAVSDSVHTALLDGDPHRRPDRAMVAAAVRDLRPLATGPVVRAVTDRVLARIGGLGPLAPLVADPTVSDILVNGGGAVWVERSGHLSRTDLAMTHEEVPLLLERVLAPLGLRLDRSSPIVDARLADGSRISAVIPPLAVDGPCVAIRRFATVPRRLEDYCGDDVAKLLRAAVAARVNVVVAGGTGAGKTSLCNALAAAIADNHRIVTIEDVAELQLDHPHVVRLEARPANSDGVGAVPIGQLVRAALRLRPDRIIVGEARGPEALDLLTAMNTGHEGSMSTLHANSPADALTRLQTMVLSAGTGLPACAVADQVAAAVHLVVQIARHPDGRRRVEAVAEPRREPNGVTTLRVLAGAHGAVVAPHRWHHPAPAVDAR